MANKFIKNKAGIPVLNPDYKPEADAPMPAYMAPVNKKALVIVSTLKDQEDMNATTNLDPPPSFKEAMDDMMSEDYANQFGTKLEDGEILEGLSNLFGLYEIPIGMMDKVRVLKGRPLHFKIDNSGSMGRDSNMEYNDASPYMKNVINPDNINFSRKRMLTRWEEAEDRLHVLIDLLAYVPTGQITYSLFDSDSSSSSRSGYNRSSSRYTEGARVVIDRNGKTPTDFMAEAHDQIRDLFSKGPSLDHTPILLNMKNMAAESKGGDFDPVNFLLTDGEPSGGPTEIAGIKKLLQSGFGITFLGVSNIAEDYEWMHEMEEIISFGVEAVSDYKDEVREVNRFQGLGINYTRGFWLLCQLVGALNPYDLCALNEPEPLTKPILETLLGRGISNEEYWQYFALHPRGVQVWLPDFDAFLTATRAIDIPTVKIYRDALASRLSQDINRGEDDNEDQDIAFAEQAVFSYRGSSGPSIKSRVQKLFGKNPAMPSSNYSSQYPKSAGYGRQ